MQFDAGGGVSKLADDGGSVALAQRALGHLVPAHPARRVALVDDLAPTLDSHPAHQRGALEDVAVPKRVGMGSNPARGEQRRHRIVHLPLRLLQHAVRWIKAPVIA